MFNPRSNLLTVWQRFSRSVVLPVACTFLALGFASESFSQQQEMGAYLKERVSNEPENSNNWRMLGHWKLEQGDIKGAIADCEKAVELDPENASAHFDLARASFEKKKFQVAKTHFEKVIELSPASKYGREADGFLEKIGAQLPTPGRVGPGSDLSPNRFGGVAGQTEIRLNSRKVFNLQIDFGMAHNSNVELAPISRDISQGQSDSLQLFIAPQMDYRAWESDSEDFGFTLNGYFTLNEGNKDDFNLQDYRPGVYFQKVFQEDVNKKVLRFQYNYALNQFSGENFARRHSFTTTWFVSRLESDSAIYWTIDYSDFAADGVDPSITSADGWTNTIGASHSFYVRRRWLQAIRGGVDVQLADLTGSDFAYDGVFLYVAGETPLPWFWEMNTQLGWGHRNYHNFTQTPSRNEDLIHASVEIYRDMTPNWRVSAFATYDRFASDHPSFDSERTLIGIVNTFYR